MQEELRRILEKIHRERGVDFREYREATLTRRLGRRLHARGARTYADYACVLDESPGEYDKLFSDLSIHVTGFFRDEGAFRALEEVALPALLHKSREMQRRLRIWSAGCATGEEPYSIAMLLLELSGGDIGQRDATVLATDMNAGMLERARMGVFSTKEVEAIPLTRLERFFIAEDRGFCVRPALRQLVAFKAHNLASDASWRDLDLVVCRNVFIYFTTALQTRVLKGFYEGLNEGGFLLLGRAETPAAETGDLFQPVVRQAKLYQKRRAGGSEEEQGRKGAYEKGACGMDPAKVSVRGSGMARQRAEAVQKVVVIGASAGGIDALTKVVSRLPGDLPAAVVIVQHLKVDRLTGLPAILGRFSPLPACLARDGMLLEAGVIYLAVPGQHCRIRNGGLFLDSEAPQNYVRPAADVLFASAAEAFGSNAVGVVLSGTGHDGTQGCGMIKAKGGMTIAQDEKTSRYFGMPDAAIAAGMIDYVLPVSRIAEKIVTLTRSQNDGKSQDTAGRKGMPEFEGPSHNHHGGHQQTGASAHNSQHLARTLREEDPRHSPPRQ